MMAGDGDAAAEARLAERLALLEGFLSRSELPESVEFALDWLERVHGINQSLCLTAPQRDRAVRRRIAGLVVPGDRQLHAVDR
jgi:hypothetical protein